MTAKSEQLYVAILTAVHNLVSEFRPTFAMCDFEKASRTGAYTAPNSKAGQDGAKGIISRAILFVSWAYRPRSAN